MKQIEVPDGFDLRLDERCEFCSNFIPTTDGYSMYGNGKLLCTETVITCSNKDLCERLEKRLKEKDKMLNG